MNIEEAARPIYESREAILACVGYHSFAKDICSCGGCRLYRMFERLGKSLTPTTETQGEK